MLTARLATGVCEDGQRLRDRFLRVPGLGADLFSANRVAEADVDLFV